MWAKRAAKEADDDRFRNVLSLVPNCLVLGLMVSGHVSISANV